MTPETMARIYAAAFPDSRAWNADEIGDLLSSNLVFATHNSVGFALGRVVAGEAELLTIAVQPDQQGLGNGQKLLTAFETEARRRAADCCFLEVAEDNTIAQRLYLRAGYEVCGTRPGYYTRADGQQIAASLLRKTLN
ncbi:ribosomal protein S18-alanine N-acetyltransferase [Shimia sp. R11_0]|uniref:ribosomal protein S18-alanine N-acetyltransferase n=1 Tax=Shimia sp. R11_0 TaxID=2821096 RepID=UPI0032AF2F10